MFSDREEITAQYPERQRCIRERQRAWEEIIQTLEQFYFLSCTSATNFQNYSFLHFYFLWEDRRQKILNSTVGSIPRINLLLISSWMQFRFVTVVLKYFNFPTFLNYLLAVILSSGLVKRHKYILSLLFVCLYSNFLCSNWYSFCHFLYNIYAFAQ
jgi:hypothetical protein